MEQHNEASHHCVKAAGFVAVTERPDDEGFINYVLRLDALALRAGPQERREPGRGQMS